MQAALWILSPEVQEHETDSREGRNSHKEALNVGEGHDDSSEVKGGFSPPKAITIL